MLHNQHISIYVYNAMYRKIFIYIKREQSMYIMLAIYIHKYNVACTSGEKI